jgi:mannose-6-phosphate isomerase-like protein (cupin superfamily)
MAIGETHDAGTTIQLGDVTIRYVHNDAASPYSLIEWTAPAGTMSPPVHVHHRTDEGFYVLSGTYGFLLDEHRIEAPAGAHVLVPKGSPHTFWNSGGETASCLIILSPPGFAEYFRELAEGLEANQSEEAAMQLRRQMSARYDIEVVGPPIQTR